MEYKNRPRQQDHNQNENERLKINHMSKIIAGIDDNNYVLLYKMLANQEMIFSLNKCSWSENVEMDDHERRNWIKFECICK